MKLIKCSHFIRLFVLLIGHQAVMQGTFGAETNLLKELDVLSQVQTSHSLHPHLHHLVVHELHQQAVRIFPILHLIDPSYLLVVGC